jgi:hypothetical protein
LYLTSSKKHHANKFELVVIETATGLKPGLYIKRMIDWCRSGAVPVVGGWVFLDKENKRAKPSYYKWDVLCELEKIQQQHPDIITQNTNAFDDFGTSRSFRQGSNTHAVNLNVTTMVIYLPLECNCNFDIEGN